MIEDAAVSIPFAAQSLEILAASTQPDMSPAALRTEIYYDEVGNVVRTVNPRGVETRIEVNALNEAVTVTRGSAVDEAVARGELITGESALGYQSRIWRDFNGRVVRTEVENRDSNTAGVGAWVESTVVYDILGNPLSSSVEVDATTTLTHTYRYDPSQLLIEVTEPAGNTHVTRYDERNLVFQVIRGFGSADESTTSVTYNRNGFPVLYFDAEDNDGDGLPETTFLTYDGFDRHVTTQDALGNVFETVYDVASQVVETRAFGHPAGAPGAGNVLLANTFYSHDELGRVFQVDRSLFLGGALTPLRAVGLSDGNSDGFVTTFVDFDALSRPYATTQDDGQVSRVTYDGADRPVEVVDAVGNRLVTHYDSNSNPVRVTSVEVSGGLVPEQVFSVGYVYDQYDRVKRATDNLGQTSRFQYDSFNQVVQRSDAEGAVIPDPLGVFPNVDLGQSGQINAAGNTVSYYYDGIGRALRQVQDLRVGGVGGGALDLGNALNPDGQITLSYEWDDNSRLAGIVDDNGNRTAFGYDALNRRVTQTNADGEVFSTVYDRDSNVREVTDPNGTVVTKSYDALHRLTQVDVARGVNVGGTTRETFSYDGLSRLVRSTDDNGAVNRTQAVERVYDSLSRVWEERQNGEVVSCSWSGDSKRTQCVYPGGRVVDYGFDAIDRPVSVSDALGAIATSEYVGPGLRELRRTFGNGTALSYLDDAGTAAVGYDAKKRVVRQRHLGVGGAAFVDREYAYNRVDMRVSERRNADFGLTDAYKYDSTYRVVETTLDQGGIAAAPLREVQAVRYELDGVGNRRSVERDTATSGTTTEAISVNDMNEYTSVGGVSQVHDDNGNRTLDTKRAVTFDYKNRPVGIGDRATGQPIALYLYFADNRRAEKQVYSQAQPAVLEKTTTFFWAGWQCVEEQDAATGATEITYVWGAGYVDELCQVERTAAHPLGAARLWVHCNVRFDVVAVTDASGAVVERRRYDDFGNVEFRDGAGAVAQASPSGLDYGFQGRRLDRESGLMYFRHRYYDPELGRFVQRDPVWDAGNVGGWYSYSGNGVLVQRERDCVGWILT